MWNSYQEEGTGTAVIYGGRTGTCQQYAEWIGERRDAELIELQSAKLSRILPDCDGMKIYNTVEAFIFI